MLLVASCVKEFEACRCDTRQLHVCPNAFSPTGNTCMGHAGADTCTQTQQQLLLLVHLHQSYMLEKTSGSGATCTLSLPKASRSYLAAAPTCMRWL
jgi:hypothetical protein